jgi:Heparinase II/III-like protein
VLLRDPPGSEQELWCRVDAGPHGFLAIAAHGHADALAVEVRVDGVDLLADPGTYCYHSPASWRSYFRSTAGHNTLEVGGADQSVSGGPFLWTRQARSAIEQLAGLYDGAVAECRAVHDGYLRLRPPVRHRRSVRLDRAERRLTIDDVLLGDAAASHDVRLRFHLGPLVRCSLAGSVAHLAWPGDDGECRATLKLPQTLSWTCARGSEDPMDGWYSPAFDVRVPAATLTGSGMLGCGRLLTSVLQLEPSPSTQGEER